MPDSFFNDTLDPTNALFLESFEHFKTNFELALAEFWSSLTTRQIEALNHRGYASLDDLMIDVSYAFSDRDRARNLTAESPEFHEQIKEGTSLARVNRALAPRNLIEFGGQVVEQHSTPNAGGLLESVPHNYVHVGVGGLMFQNLSPIDPLFYLHHANVDRLWEVWSQMQVSEGLPIYPPDDQFSQWGAECFDFFIDGNGNPISNTPLSDYLQNDRFTYTYEPIVMGESRPPVVTVVPQGSVYRAELISAKLSEKSPVEARVRLPANLITDSLRAEGATLVMRIKIQSPMPADAWEFSLAVNSNSSEIQAAEFVGLLIIFGAHGGHHQHGDYLNFVIDLNLALNKLDARGGLNVYNELVFTIQSKLTGRQVPETDSLDVHEMEVKVVG